MQEEQGKPLFIPSYNVAEVFAFQEAIAHDIKATPPLPYWTPAPYRAPLPTDIDPARFNTQFYVPLMGKTPPLNARLLVVLGDSDGTTRGSHMHGTVIAYGDTPDRTLLIELDEMTSGAKKVAYPVDYEGLYVDTINTSKYRALIELRELYGFTWEIEPTGEVERIAAQVEEPYMFVVRAPDRRLFTGSSPSRREAIEQIYLTLCVQEYIVDPVTYSPGRDDLDIEE